MSGPLTYLSVCSGIEAASVAWEPLGWRPWAFSEIDPFPASVLAHRFGANMPGEPPAGNGVPNLGDMTRFKEWPDGAIDLLVGGTPCQDYSVAGKRAGMAGARGQLTLTFVGIARRYRPRWIVWENVPGVLSSNGGRDFAAFLRDLGECGYGWAYRVLDAQHVRTCRHRGAVPQRRRRVFVVGYLGDWRPPAAVFLEPEGLRGDPPPRREAGQGVAGTLAARTRGGGGLGTDVDLDGGLIYANSGDAGYCLTASAQQSLDAETETLIAVAHTLRGEGFDAGEDGTGRGVPLVPVAFDCKASAPQSDDCGATPTLRAMGHAESHANAGGQLAVAFGFNARQDPDAWEGRAGPVDTHSGTQAVAFAENSRAELRLCGGAGDVAAQLTTGGGKPGQGQPVIAIQERAVSENLDNGPGGKGFQEGCAYTLEARNKVQSVATAWAVRRLTPMECERLQGFPDAWTAVPYRRGPASDGPRYKALGNSMAVNCMEWIGRRIELVRDVMAEGDR